jgi:hypothetical protein
MKLLCLLKMAWNFISSKFGATTLSISLGNWWILVPKMCYKNSSYRRPSQQIGLKLQIWEEEVQRHIKTDLIVLKCQESCFKGHLLRWCENFKFPVSRHGDFEWHADFWFSWAENVVNWSKIFRNIVKLTILYITCKIPEDLIKIKWIIMPKQMYHENCSATKTGNSTHTWE